MGFFCLFHEAIQYMYILYVLKYMKKVREEFFMAIERKDAGKSI